MNRFLILLKADAKQMYRDPMLGLMLLAPLLLTAFVSVFLPYLSKLLNSRFSVDITEYYDVIASFAVLLIPLICGLFVGLMVLDERDESIMNYLAITPLAKSGYLLYRFTLPVLLSVGYCLYLLQTVNLVSLSGPRLIFILPMLGLEATLLTLFLAAFASNKIEGLALSKAGGLLILAPVASFLLPFPWQLLAGVFPSYWVAGLIWLPAETASLQVLGFGTAGWLVHGFLFLWLFRRFNQKLD